MLRRIATLTRRGVVPIGFGCALFFAAAPARAADATVGECLAASEASLKFGNAHQRLEERAELGKCAASSCPEVIREECARRLDEVKRIVPSFVLDVRDAANQRVRVQVEIDGQPLTDAADDSPIAVNPGQHRLLIAAAGYPTVTREVVLSEGEIERTIHVQLAAAPANGANSAPEASAPAAPEQRGSTQRAFAWATAGVAIAGLGVGSAFGALAWSKRRHAREVCPDRCADDAGVEAWADAKRAGNVSTIAFAVGGAAAIASTALWITLPKSDARLEVGVGNVSIRGSW